MAGNHRADPDTIHIIRTAVVSKSRDVRRARTSQWLVIQKFSLRPPPTLPFYTSPECFFFIPRDRRKLMSQRDLRGSIYCWLLCPLSHSHALTNTAASALLTWCPVRDLAQMLMCANIDRSPFSDFAWRLSALSFFIALIIDRLKMKNTITTNY